MVKALRIHELCGPEIKCPFMCFCKPSAANQFYTSGPLKLENSLHVVVVPPKTDFAVSDASEKASSQDIMLKSCLRKAPYDDSTKEVAKKRVHWIDISGKQLYEIKEFESRCLDGILRLYMTMEMADSR